MTSRILNVRFLTVLKIIIWTDQGTVLDVDIIHETTTDYNQEWWIEIPELSDAAEANFNYLYKDWNDILTSDLKPLSLESSQQCTAAASPELKKYEVKNHDHQLPTPEPTSEASEFTLELTIDSDQSGLTDCQTNQPGSIDLDQIDLTDHLINTSIFLLKRKLTQSVSVDIQSEHIIQEKQIRT